MQRAGNVEHRASVEVIRGAPRVQRRRHDDDAQVVPRLPGLLGKRNPKVRVDTALVELVEDDAGEVGQQWILLQACGQDALGGDEEARVR